MDAATQGTVLHESMQAIYDSLLPPGHSPGQIYVRHITASLIQSWLDGGEGVDIEAIVAGKIKEKYPPASRMDKLTGDAALMAEIISRYVRHCLQADIRIAPFDYLDNERKVTVQYPLRGGRKVNMTFIIDRLDRLITARGSRLLRIVDYKTGSDAMGFKKIDDLFHPSQNAGNTKGIFQLMLYSLLYPLYDKGFGSQTPIALSLYSTRSLEVNGFRTMVEFQEEPIYSHLPLIDEYKELLDNELSSLFNLEQPFGQTTDREKCLFCDFRKLCGR